MNFPTLVYRTPGPHHAATGTYDYRAVKSAEELEEAKTFGWFLTLQGAIDGEEEEPQEPEGEAPAVLLVGDTAVVAWLSGKLVELEITHDDGMTADELLFIICHEFAKPAESVDPVETEEAEDNSAPTREELEAKAVELEVKFDGRTTDKVLAEKIQYILSQQEQ